MEIWFFWLSYLAASFIAVRLIVYRLRKADNLVVLSFAPMAVAVVNHLHENMFELFPRRRIDLYVNQFDGLIGFPANRAAIFMHEHKVISALAIADYFGIVLILFVTVAVVSRLRGYDELIDCIPMIMLSGLVAMPIYWLFPASGPQYAFPNFPAVYTGTVHPINLQSIPNCLPSIHFSLALIVAYMLRHWRWGIAFGIVHVLLTGLATIGLGEHYAIDLILAFPYTYLIIRISQSALILSPLPLWSRQDHRHATTPLVSGSNSGE